MSFIAECEIQQRDSSESKNSTEILDRVIKVIYEQLDIEKSKIEPGSHLIKDLGADSLDTVELVMAFEEEFELDIPDEVAEKINTVESVVDLIRSEIA